MYLVVFLLGLIIPTLASSMILHANEKFDLTTESIRSSGSGSGDRGILKNQLRRALLRSGIVQEQPRHSRQALHFQHFLRQQCSSHLISAFMRMEPDRTHPGEYQYVGSRYPSDQYSMSNHNIIHIFFIFSSIHSRPLCCYQI